MRTTDCPHARGGGRSAPATCLEEAVERQERCRDRYREVIGTSYANDAYANLLEATRAVLHADRD